MVVEEAGRGLLLFVPSIFGLQNTQARCLHVSRYTKQAIFRAYAGFDVPGCVLYTAALVGAP
jgi:hypothetical protein